MISKIEYGVFELKLGGSYVLLGELDSDLWWKSLKYWQSCVVDEFWILYGSMCSWKLTFIYINTSWELISNIKNPLILTTYPRNKDFLALKAVLVLWLRRVEA